MTLHIAAFGYGIPTIGIAHGIGGESESPSIFMLIAQFHDRLWHKKPAGLIQRGLVVIDYSIPPAPMRPWRDARP